jgi:hypothetical protein
MTNMGACFRRPPPRLLPLACLATLLILIIANADAMVHPPTRRELAVPRRVLLGAETLVVRRVGRPFYQKHMILDAEASTFSQDDWSAGGPHWTLTYRVRGNRGSQSAVVVDVDRSGQAFGDQAVHGTADCAREPTACEFALDEKAARSVARKGGLAPGTKDWGVRLTFVNGSWQRYAWSVQSTHGDGCDAGGESYLIDPDTGEIFERSEWFTICCNENPASTLAPPDTVPGPVER